jgi:hypothetical protein
MRQDKNKRLYSLNMSLKVDGEEVVKKGVYEIP